jgi:hypothetical protein
MNRRVRPDGDPADLVQALRGDPSVEVATLDYPRRITGTPNDPGRTQGLQSQYLSTVRLPEAWDRITNAASQIVAVIDTGVDTAHPGLGRSHRTGLQRGQSRHRAHR